MPRINKNIPNCLNCNNPFSEADQFCSNCSQKRTDGLITVKDLFSDFFSTVFNIDGKLANTIKDLFIPGKLTTAFFAGQHEKYYKPLRMFFVFMVAHLAILSLTIFNAKNMVNTGNFENELVKVQHKKEIKLSVDTLLLEQRQQFKSKKETIVLDSISSKLSTRYFNNMDSITLTDVINGIGEMVVFNIDLNDYVVAVDDIHLLDNDFETFSEKYGVSGFWEKLSLQQSFRVSTDPKGSFNYVLGNMTWMLILLIPAIALILKLLYVRNDFYFVQHLTFLFHNHAFAFLLVSIIAITSYIVSSEVFGAAAFFLSMIGLYFYLFIAMKRYYGQGFIKTFLKYNFVIFSYLIISLTFFVLTIMLSFALYS